jgi:hypothetical protein
MGGRQRTAGFPNNVKKIMTMDCPNCKNGELLCGNIDPPPSARNLIGKLMKFVLCPRVTRVDASGNDTGESVGAVTAFVVGSDYNSVMVHSERGESCIRDRFVISIEEESTGAPSAEPEEWRIGIC